MSIIDIRNNSGEINDILFADASIGACLLDKETSDSVRLIDADGYKNNRILISDIPNLIKALEKAYELWGEKK